MKIADIMRNKQTYSFEIFPPRGDLPVEHALEVAGALADQGPDWISVTFSAGGTGNSGNTAKIAGAIERTCHTSALAHLTCLGSTKADVDAYLDELERQGVENVLALRGDRAPGREAIDFEYASDLIAYIKGTHPNFSVGAACYTEGHVEAASLKEDIYSLKAKQEAGADFLVTQLFFDNECFYRFRELCAKHRVKLPITVGIMPFTSTAQIQRMAFTCGASIPASVIKRLVAAGDDTAAQAQAGIDYAIEQLVDLAGNGVDGLHVYTMNKPAVAAATHRALKACGYLE